METERDSGRLIWGVILLGLGALLLLGNLGLIERDLLSRWWPVILILVGVVLLLRRTTPGIPSAERMEERAPLPGWGETGPGEAQTDSAAVRRRHFPTGAVILIGIGVAFLLDDVLGGDAFPALVLIAIGVALLLRQYWK